MPRNYDGVSNPESKRYIIEERNGKISYMSGARLLLILMRRPSQYWDYTRCNDSRFSEVAVLHYGRCLDIRDRIETRMLSPNTFYAAYLVFKLTSWSKGLQSVEAAVNFFDVESDRNAQERAYSVYLQHRRGQWGSFSARRVDGWMEVEIGNFYVDGQDKAVEARVLEFNSWKAGLIVEGIEFRPLSTESTQFSHLWGYQLVHVPDTSKNVVFPPLFPIGDVSSDTDETMVADDLWRMVERKDMEADDLKQKLLKSEFEAQLAIAAKDSEVEQLRRKVENFKVEALKAQQYQQELNKANKKINEFERKLEDCDARAICAVEEYKKSEELKVDKYKFASKSFTLGFQLCVKQVLEVDPSFDTSRIDVKRLEASSSFAKI